MKINKLLLAGLLTLLASLLHVAIIIGGADWYRFFGAGEGMAYLEEIGSPEPAIVTSFIALMLLFWALYAFSALGRFPKLPFTKIVLHLIAFVFLGRGVLGVPLVYLIDAPYLLELRARPVFMVNSSLFCLFLAWLYFIGIRQYSKTTK